MDTGRILNCVAREAVRLIRQTFPRGKSGQRRRQQRTLGADTLSALLILV